MRVVELLVQAGVLLLLSNQWKQINSRVSEISLECFLHGEIIQKLYMALFYIPPTLQHSSVMGSMISEIVPQNTVEWIKH